MTDEERWDVLQDTFPDAMCGIGPTGGGLWMCDENGENTVCEPANETDEVFLDRIAQSREAGRNLFFEEWEPYETHLGVVE